MSAEFDFDEVCPSLLHHLIPHDLEAPMSSLKRLQVFSGDNQPLERGDSSSSASLLDSPLCQPMHASSAARKVPPRPLDDDNEDEVGGGDPCGRSFHSFGQSRCGMDAAAGDGANTMPRVGSAPSQMGREPRPRRLLRLPLRHSYLCAVDWSWAAPSRRRSSVDSAPSTLRARATPPPPFPFDDADADPAPSPPPDEWKPVGLHDFELLHVIGQVTSRACSEPPSRL